MSDEDREREARRAAKAAERLAEKQRIGNPDKLAHLDKRTALHVAALTLGPTDDLDRLFKRTEEIVAWLQKDDASAPISVD